MRISDWSSDVCSSDLISRRIGRQPACSKRGCSPTYRTHQRRSELEAPCRLRRQGQAAGQDRKSVVWGKSVSVRVDLVGRRIIKKKINKQENNKSTLYAIQ